MLLKNWVLLHRAPVQITSITNDTTHYTINPKTSFNQSLEYLRGAYKSIIGNGASYIQNEGGGSTSDAGQRWVDIGYGDTAPTFDDYQLADSNYANPQLTVLSVSSFSLGDKELFNVQINVRNDSGANVIVKEIGLGTTAWLQVYNSYGSGTGQIRNILLARKVLDTPLTIAPGESYSFTYVVKLKDN